MKKRIMGALLVATLVISQAVSVFAAGSATTDVKPGDGFTVDKDFDYLPDDVQDQIDAIDKGDLTGLPDAIQKELDGMKLMGGMFDMKVNGAKPDADGYYTVTLSVPGVKAGMTVKILHYDPVNGVWETIGGVVNADGTVTVRVKYFSPYGVFAVAGVTGTPKTTDGGVKSPKTGDWA